MSAAGGGLWKSGDLRISRSAVICCGFGRRGSGADEGAGGAGERRGVGSDKITTKNQTGNIL